MPWEPLWPRDELTRSSFRRRLRHYARELREDQGYALFILDDNERLLGGLTLSNVRRGVTQAASLGYWLGAPYVRRGYMTEAVRAMIPFAQGPLRLHRVEAACLPEQPSVDRGSRKKRLCPGGLRAPLPQDCRPMAGSRPFRLGGRGGGSARRGGGAMTGSRSHADVGSSRGERGWWQALAVLLALLISVVMSRRGPGHEADPIPADPDRIEITTLGEYFDGRGDTLQVETATASDGSAGRMMVRATTPGTNPNWIVFGLTNPTDKPMERWLTAERYNVIGSGAIWPISTRAASRP